MAFQPEKIKREHVIKAFEEIDSGNWEIRPSTIYDIVYNGKRYPPKDTMRLAHEAATGEYLWHPGGGEPTNKYLKALGFEVVNKLESVYINVKAEFAQWLLINAPESYNYYLGGNVESVIKRLDEIDAFFPDYEFFEIDESKISEKVAEIKFLLSTKERKNNPEFVTYDIQKSNGIPKAVMGKNNYIKFLKSRNNTIPKMTDITRFSWVKTHNQLSQFLIDKENQQPQLIDILEGAGATLFNDQNPKGVTFKMDEIDPFTFYCYIYKYGPETRLSILKNIAKSINLFVPDDDSGIPSTNPQKVWLFTYKFDRNNNEVQRLWNFFYAAMDDSINEDLFADILQIKGVAKTKLTEALFYVAPENYFPINGPTRPYLEEVLKIDPKFETLAEYQNILDQIKSKSEKPFYELSYDAWLWKNKTSQLDNETNTENTMSTSLNTILFGPPGTGKTYNSINEALKIVVPKFYQENKENRTALNDKFKELLIKKWEETKGQIAFCTFHQSFSYEDFVEGIKPMTKDGNVTYDIQNGVFKKICQLADSNLSTIKLRKEGKLSWDEETFRKASFYKLSLGDSSKYEDRVIYEYCRDHNYIAIGFGDDIDFTGLSESEITNKLEDEGYKDSSAQMLNYFIHYLKIGNYVIISNGNQYVRALGKVTGVYEFNPNSQIQFNHFRKVEWIFVDENIPIEEIYNVGLSQRTIYKIDEAKLKPEFFIKQGQASRTENEEEKNYVLIIDEINRGNVSSIFGELITLIEKDKRAGKDEELEVILPYSKEPFKVPHNVFIIGTMNTADRSVEALDTALRRRFTFKEFPPEPELTLTEGKSGTVNGVITINGIEINLDKLLITINRRIEKLIDKDHKIGHSYFLKVNSEESLKRCFKNEIIPLLEEYFFGDFGKIGLVLGNSFVEKKTTKGFSFAEFDGYESDIVADLLDRPLFKIRPQKDWDFSAI